MNRREKLLRGLDLRTMVGIEFGALSRPVVSRTDANIFYVDYTDTQTLRDRYRDDPNVDVEAIVDVDIIWEKSRLKEMLGGQRIDYVIASHVIEHVPDLLGWLEELRSVLGGGGEIRLAVPDRRFTFDYLRRPTELADIVNAHLLQARAPLPIAILDFMINFVDVPLAEAWQGQLDPDKLKHQYTVDGAINVAIDAIQNGTYHDVHCWVFTPHSFAKLFEQASKANLINFECKFFHGTPESELEFIVGLRESSNRALITDSWQRARQIADGPHWVT